MRYFFSLLLLVFCLSTLQAQQAQERYDKLIIYANSSDLQRLAEAGVPVDHGKFKRETFLISDFSESQILTIQELGINYEVLMTDVVNYYQARMNPNHKTHGAFTFGDAHLNQFKGGSACGAGGSSGIDYPQPSNFSLGSMGGYYTYQEFVDNLDSMASKYPNIITSKAPIDSSGINFQTHDGNPVYWLKISDNPSVDENEPEVMFSAIHHAREPASLSQTMYFMWYLLENYGTDAEVTYLVDNVEMYFVPMINPDGYRYNELIQPGGGGMWRKNRRNNGGGDYGVDLNRNYSYQFGVSGASSDPWDDTYKGTGPFSEPETRAMRAFHFDHDFRIALNSHTYGNLLLHPFGYAAVQTSDHDIFTAYTAHMVSQNGFSNILSSDLYPAAGDSDDWGYDGDLGQKPKVMSMTPEVGSDSHGFWPASSEIISICKSTVFMNLTAAHLTYIFGTVKDANPYVMSDMTGYLKFDMQRLGMESGQLTVSVAPVGFGITSVGSPKNYTPAAVLDIENDSISYTLDAAILPGQSFQYELSISNGFYTWKDTVEKIYGQGNIIIADNGNSMSNWSSSSWNTTSNEFYSPSSSITDSPNGDYQNSANTTNTLTTNIDLTNAISATASFYCMWDIEDNYDYCQIMASPNGTTWTPLCGLYTQNGTNDQDAGEPVWDGVQSSWVKEEIDLSDFLGQTIELRFRLVSDNFVKGDGFYYDDFEVSTIESAPDGVEEYELTLGQNMPNPASDYTYIPHQINASKAHLNIYDAFGKLVLSTNLNPSALKTKISTQSLADGVYYYQVIADGLTSQSRRMVVVK